MVREHCGGFSEKGCCLPMIKGILVNILFASQVSQCTWDPTATTSVCGPSSFLSVLPRPTVTTGIVSVLSRTGKAAAVQAKTISDMIMSMKLQRPRLTPVLPQWDLGIVLKALSKPSYEPLREASLKQIRGLTRSMRPVVHSSGPDW